MSKIARKMVEEMQLSWEYGQSFHPYSTVRMNEMPRFYVGKLLLHHYRKDLAHISYLYSLVIEVYKSERWAKDN